MEKIKITFLGTSSAVPTLTRNHTAILLSYKNENILFDCGEGTQRQFRKAKINPCKTTKLVLTHLHGDHVFGIPGLFQTLNLNNYQKTLESNIKPYTDEYSKHKSDPFPTMIDYLKENIKFRRRCIIVTINNGKLTTLIPNAKAKVSWVSILGDWH